MTLDSELHSPKNEAGCLSDHPDVAWLQVIHWLHVIQLIEFVVSLS